MSTISILNQEITDEEGTYRIRVTNGFGDPFLLMVVWDNDQLWGSFEIGKFKAVFRIEKPPAGDYLKFPGEVCDLNSASSYSMLQCAPPREP